MEWYVAYYFLITLEELIQQEADLKWNEDFIMEKEQNYKEVTKPWYIFYVKIDFHTFQNNDSLDSSLLQ